MLFRMMLPAATLLAVLVAGCGGSQTLPTERVGGWLDLTLAGDLPGTSATSWSGHVESDTVPSEDARRDGLTCGWATQLTQPSGGDACLGHYDVRGVGFGQDDFERAEVDYSAYCYGGAGSLTVVDDSEWEDLDFEVTIPDDHGDPVEWRMNDDWPCECEGAIDEGNASGWMDCVGVRLSNESEEAPLETETMTLSFEWSCGEAV